MTRTHPRLSAPPAPPGLRAQSRLRGRSGFTLIELLVVMAITAALGLLALMLLPGISNSDSALKATEEVRAQVKISQALAGASRQPRGVRFLTGGVAANPLAATELQLLESPPVMVIDPLTLVTPGGPFVELVYDLTDGTEPDPASTTAPPAMLPPGAVKFRHCYIANLTTDQRGQVEPGALLALPTLGAWSRITRVIGPAPSPAYPGGTIEVELDVYPDAALGATTAYRTYHAGIYGVPVPLLGQPTIPLPKNVAVDLEVSSPPPVVGIPYDIMFAPDGQTVTIGRQASNAGVFLWVRDITKVVNPAPGAGGSTTSMRYSQGPAPAYTNGTEYTSAAVWADAFRRGGEHHAVAINNGAVGTAPIQWPDATGNFPQGPARTNVFAFARKKLN